MTKNTKSPGLMQNLEQGASNVAGAVKEAVKSVVEAGTANDDRGLRLAAAKDLKDLVFKDIPDVRGWTVEFRDGIVAGKVSRILVDQQMHNAPRYLDIAIDAKLLGATKPVSHDLLVPIGRAQIAKDRDVILLPFVTKEMLPKVPMLGPGAIDFKHETALVKAYGLEGAFQNADALYKHDWFSLKDFLVLRPMPAK